MWRQWKAATSKLGGDSHTKNYERRFVSCEWCTWSRRVDGRQRSTTSARRAGAASLSLLPEAIITTSLCLSLTRSCTSVQSCFLRALLRAACNAPSTWLCPFLLISFAFACKCLLVKFFLLFFFAFYHLPCYWWIKICKKAIFSKTKQLRTMVSIDDL